MGSVTIPITTDKALMGENTSENRFNMRTPIEWKDQRVITTALLAEVYETDENNIKNNFNNHKDNFVKGKHYYLLQGEELKDFKRLVNDIDEPLSEKIKFAPQLYLWTERGANRHCKILDTDKAWEQFDNLEETYFNVKQNMIDLSQLSPELQMFNEIFQSVARQQLEQKRQAEKIEELSDNLKELAAKVTTHNDDYYTIAGYASIRGLNVDINKANMLGRKASKLSREYEYPIGKTKDPRFGTVNTYHVDILKEIFKK